MAQKNTPPSAKLRCTRNTGGGVQTPSLEWRGCARMRGRVVERVNSPSRQRLDGEDATSFFHRFQLYYMNLKLTRLQTHLDRAWAWALIWPLWPCAQPSSDLMHRPSVHLQAHRGCPICRQHSDFVVASELHLTGEERQVCVSPALCASWLLLPLFGWCVAATLFAHVQDLFCHVGCGSWVCTCGRCLGSRLARLWGFGIGS